MLACRRLVSMHPDASVTSMKRSKRRNAAKGGSPASKHLLGMAMDMVWDEEPSEDRLREIEHEAKILGLWARYHDGHLHVQGLPPGEPSDGWKSRYGGVA